MKHELLALLLIGMPALVQAQEHVTIARTIPYARDAVGNEDVRSACDWNTQLSTYVTRYSGGQVSATDNDLSSVPGAVLTMSIADVHTSGGGGFSGPKWAIIRGELHSGGKVVGTFRFRRVSDRPFGFSGCGTLDHLAKTLGADVARWLKSGHPDVVDSADTGASPADNTTH